MLPWKPSGGWHPAHTTETRIHIVFGTTDGNVLVLEPVDVLYPPFSVRADMLAPHVVRMGVDAVDSNDTMVGLSGSSIV